jgi:hypothetical protein
MDSTENQAAAWLEAHPKKDRPSGTETSQAGLSAGPSPLRDAIIFIPGVSSAGHMDSMHMAEVLCNELDRAAETTSAKFVVRPSAAESDTELGIVRTISRIDGQDVTSVADVYTFKHSADFRADEPPKQAVVRVLTLALSVMAGVLIWFTAWFGRHRRAKKLRQMIQLLFCLTVLLLLGAYLVLSVVAVVQLFGMTFASGTGAADITAPQGLVVVGGVLAAIFPKAREQLSQSAEHYLSMMRYLWVAGSRNALRGEMQSFLERVSERGDVDRLHVVGFSFGSLVALDMVFPSSGPPPPRVSTINSLVTIGCPFDLVRMLHPAYAENRFAPQRTPYWFNIYEPTDVLGSDFSDEDEAKKSKEKGHLKSPRGVGIADSKEEKGPATNLAWNPHERLTWVSVLMLTSLRVHWHYWEANPQAESALRPMVEKLFAGTPALA